MKLLADKMSSGDILDKEEWVPFKLTLVEYPKGDTLGKILAALSLLPFASKMLDTVFDSALNFQLQHFLSVAILHFGFFVVIRDLHSFFYGIGIIINHVINHFLKVTIKVYSLVVSKFKKV